MIKATVKANVGRPFTAWVKKDSKKVGTAMKSNVDERTAAGRDANGQPFKPYSPEYAEKHPGTPDLRETGKLMNSLKVSATDTDAAVSTNVDYAAAVNEQRPFMGIAPAEVEEIMDIVEAAWDEHAKEANKGVSKAALSAGGKR